MVILRGLGNLPHEMVYRFFIQQGIILLVLNLIFRNDVPTQIRAKLVDLVLRIDSQVLASFVPIDFFAEIRDMIRRGVQYNAPEMIEKLLKFVEDFDAPHFENVFVKWNSLLKEQSHQSIRLICQQIASGELGDLRLRELEPFRSNESDEDIRTGSIILRQFNANPSVFLNKKLNTFITDVSTELYKVSQEFFKLRQENAHSSQFV